MKCCAIQKYNLSLHSQNDNGAVVQLVRIHACHAWGRGFESRPHRRQKEFWNFSELFLFYLSAFSPLCS